MDPRKQKRLGLAPIASFEKSFEDTTSLTPSISQQQVAAASNAPTFEEISSLPLQEKYKDEEVVATHLPTNINQQVDYTQEIAKEFYGNGDGDGNGNAGVIQKMDVNDSGTVYKKTITTRTTTLGSAPANMGVIGSGDGDVENTKATTNNSNKNEITTATTTSTIKRAPPLKATANTLVSSSSIGAGDLTVSTFKGASTLCTPSTPRIELSRASSSSHHEEDSRDSSPENVFEQVGTGTLQETLDMGFREEGALELRSSTEELYFMDPTQKKEEAKIQQQQQQQTQQQQNKQHTSPLMYKMEDQQSYLQQHQRKDSASSEVAALLCISGRTSRISSVGSQGSAVSRLSAVSGVSRSPSPHRMLLETSFCGPKPVESLVDGSVGSVVEAPTSTLLEQVLLARTRDPTEAVFAEGIKVESSPKKKPPTSLTNGDAKLTAKIKAQNKPDMGALQKTTIGSQRKSTKSPGQMIVGRTPSGTEYIRINLKPDFMYDDKGIAKHEKVVEAPNTIQPVYAARAQTKPASLSLTQKTRGENLLTPNASPKPTRKGEGSRSPSPATVSVSRKSSFSSLFRFGGGGKDSPDSPRDRSRPRSKSKERGQTPQSQNATPNKQKSVLAIFKPGKRGSSAGGEGSKTSKTSSPTDNQEMQQLQSRSKSHTPVVSATGSRPNSRLKYYDDPVEGYIHIPLHTPPEEKEARKLLQSIQQLNAEPIRPQATAITMSDLESAVKKLKPVSARKNSETAIAPPAATNNQRPQPFPLKRIENLDAIHSLPQDDNKERTWSLEVNRHSSQDSQETVGSGESYVSAIKRSQQLAEVKEHVVHENGIEAEIHRLPSQESTTSANEVRVVETKATINTSAIVADDTAARERRKLMFATRVGSGSQEQIFATQFSISKTESISSHMSEHTQDTLSESITENLKRQNTVIKKTSSPEEVNKTVALVERTEKTQPPPPQEERKENREEHHTLKKLNSQQAIAQIEEQREIMHKSESRHSLERQITTRKKSISTSEDERTKPQPPLVMRRKTSGGTAAAVEEKQRLQSRSTSEDDQEVVTAVANHRHSRYLENFDVRKKYHENVTGTMQRKPRKLSGGAGGDINPPESKTQIQEQYQRKPQPQLPQPPPPSTEPSPLHTPSPSVQEQEVYSPTTGQQRSAARSHSQSPVDKARQTPPKPPRTTTPTRRSQTDSPSAGKPTTTVTTYGAHKKHHTHVDRSSVLSTDDPVESSESERDSDMAALESKRRHLALNIGCIEDHESTGLVSQESFDDELPYIPTTLPEEKAQGVNLIPMKERANMEVKTCPLDRPRSTTPLNPSHLEEYIGGVGVNTPDSPFELAGSALVRGEKLRISLPRKDSKKDVQSSKSPRRISNASGKSWFEFAEEGLRATAHLERKDSNKQLIMQKPIPPPPPPPHPPPQMVQFGRKSEGEEVHGKSKTPSASKPPVTTPKASTQRKLSGHWIDFENIPEKRKPPKKITTLPRDTVSHSTTTLGRSQGKSLPLTANCSARHTALAQAQAFSQQPQQHKHSHPSHHHHQPDVTASTLSTGDAGNMMTLYNYVKPEDCQCECHETKTKEAQSTSTTETSTTTTTAPIAHPPPPPSSSTSSTTLNNNSKAQGVDLLPKGEDMLPLLSQDSHEGIEPSDSSREYSCYTDDELDLPTRSSTRSKSSSSKMDKFPRRDIAHSPRNKKFPDK